MAGGSCALMCYQLDLPVVLYEVHVVLVTTKLTYRDAMTIRENRNQNEEWFDNTTARTIHIALSFPFKWYIC